MVHNYGDLDEVNCHKGYFTTNQEDSTLSSLGKTLPSPILP